MCEVTEKIDRTPALKRALLLAVVRVQAMVKRADEMAKALTVEREHDGPVPHA